MIESDTSSIQVRTGSVWASPTFRSLYEIILTEKKPRVTYETTRGQVPPLWVYPFLQNSSILARAIDHPGRQVLVRMV